MSEKGVVSTSNNSVKPAILSESQASDVKSSMLVQSLRDNAVDYCVRGAGQAIHPECARRVEEHPLSWNSKSHYLDVAAVPTTSDLALSFLIGLLVVVALPLLAVS